MTYDVTHEQPAAALTPGRTSFESPTQPMAGGFEFADGLHIWSTADPAADADQVRVRGLGLRTTAYLKRRFISGDEVASDGLYHDEWDDRSVVFFAKRHTKEATGRMILCNKKGGLGSLPTVKQMKIDPDSLKEAVGTKRIRDIDPTKTVEISAVAASGSSRVGEIGAVLALYTTMLRHSLEQGHTTWILNTHPLFQRMLRAMAGEEQVHKIGEPRQHMGTIDTPFAIRTQDLARKLLTTSDPARQAAKEHLIRALEGADVAKIPADIRQLMTGRGIPWNSPSRLESILGSRKALARIGFNGTLIAYTAARAASLSQISEFHGNIGIFYVLDAAPVPLYVWGVENMLSGKDARTRALGALAAAGTFAAPYLYAGVEGSHYPAYVAGVAAGCIAFTAGMQVKERLTGTRKERNLHAVLSASPIE